MADRHLGHLLMISLLGPVFSAGALFPPATARLGFRATVAAGLALVAGVAVTAGVGLSISLGALERQIRARGLQQVRWAAADLVNLGAPSVANAARALDVLLDDHLRVQAAGAALLVEAAEDGGREPEYVVDALRQIVVRSPTARIDVVPAAPGSPGYSTAPVPFGLDGLDPVLREVLYRPDAGVSASPRFGATVGLPVRQAGDSVVKVAGAALPHRPGVVQIEYLVDTRQAASVYGAGGDALARELAGGQVAASARLVAHAVDLAREAGWSSARLGGRLRELVRTTAVERVVVVDEGGVESNGAATPEAVAFGRVPGHREARLDLAASGRGAAPLEGWHDSNRRWIAAAAATRSRGRVTVSLEQETYTGRGTLVETAWQSEVDRLVAAGAVDTVWVASVPLPGQGGSPAREPELVAAAPRSGHAGSPAAGPEAGAGVLGDGGASRDAWERWSAVHGRYALAASGAGGPGGGVSDVLVDLLRPARARVVSGVPVGGPRPGARVAHVVLVEQPVGEAAFEMRRQAASMVGLAVVLVVALAGTTVVATRRAVTAPLEAVAEAAHCLRGGVRPSREILARIGRRRDEIGSLARHFDVMAGELLSRHEALEAAVQERTRSLKAANGRIRASQARFESDLRVAQEVQAALAPEESWTVGDLEIRCRMAPARRLSGDFLNVQRRSGDVFAAVSDVSGKGLGAALFMAVSQTVLTGAAGRQRSVSALLADANVRLCRRNPVGMFVTSFAACAVPGQGVVQFSCAGHEAPFLLSPDGAVCRLPRQDNVALGVDPESSFVSVGLDLDPGQTLVAFTDGVTDALNASGEPFGEERLQALLEAFPPRGGVDDLVEAVWTGTAEFAAGAEAADDKTLLVLHRRSGA